MVGAPARIAGGVAPASIGVKRATVPEPSRRLRPAVQATSHHLGDQSSPFVQVNVVIEDVERSMARSPG